MTRRGLFTAIATSLAAGLAGCAGLSGGSGEPRIAMTTTLTEALPEGSEATIVLSRDRETGPLDLQLAVSGTAAPAVDYRVVGAEAPSDDRYLVRIPAGADPVELTLEVLDDPAAEAAKSAVLRLEAGAGYRPKFGARRVELALAANDFAVTTIADTGDGSLRQAILNANAFGDGALITFDQEAGPFGPPQRIELARDLPALTGTYTIEGYLEDRLWEASGVIVSGMERHRIFEVAPGANIAIRNLTITEGEARDGAGILNRGELVVSGVTFEANHARRDGGALMHKGGSLNLVNSTLTGNSAGRAGGGLASNAPARVVHVTFADNRVDGAPDAGASVHSTAALHLANSILWSGENRLDCLAEIAPAPAQGHNLIGRHRNCGEPLLEGDPQYEALNYFNGPARTIALSGRSPAINLSDNSLSVDETGQPLSWDQRGNGDPRFVAGYADLGAFEVQAFPVLRVNTTEETGLRSCFPSNNASCPLRAAIELALADDRGRSTLVGFDPDSIPNPAVITLQRPLPVIDRVLTLEAPEGYAITVRIPATGPVPGDKLRLAGVRIETY